MALTVTAATRRAAILKIMGELGVLEVGARLRLTELMAAWTRVGLRADDLSSGLNECIEGGVLQFAPGAQDSAVWITEAGKAWLETDESRTAEAAGRDGEDQTLQAAQQRGSVADKNAPPPFRDRRKN